MFDHFLRGTKDTILTPLANVLRQVHPTTVTVIALLIGLVGAGALAYQYYLAGLLLWFMNRFLDGLDGLMARMHDRQSDLGGYIDIVFDFVAYAAFPIGLTMGLPSSQNYLALAYLLGMFYINAASWMYLAAILEKRKHGVNATGEFTSVTMPAGIIGGTETVILFSLFMLLPQYLAWLFALMASLLVITVVQRLMWATRNLT